jgi:hypothetical protein
MFAATLPACSDVDRPGGDSRGSAGGSTRLLRCRRFINVRHRSLRSTLVRLPSTKKSCWISFHRLCLPSWRARPSFSFATSSSVHCTRRRWPCRACGLGDAWLRSMLPLRTGARAAQLGRAKAPSWHLLLYSKKPGSTKIGFGPLGRRALAEVRGSAPCPLTSGPTALPTHHNRELNPARPLCDPVWRR